LYGSDTSCANAAGCPAGWAFPSRLPAARSITAAARPAERWQDPGGFNLRACAGRPELRSNPHPVQTAGKANKKQHELTLCAAMMVRSDNTISRLHLSANSQHEAVTVSWYHSGRDQCRMLLHSCLTTARWQIDPQQAPGWSAQ
jgi:hypothetical protein